MKKSIVLKKSKRKTAEKNEWPRKETAAILENEALRRALKGTEEHVFYKGEITGAKTKYSDALLIALLKAHCPEKYGKAEKDKKLDIGKALRDALKRLKK